MHNKLDGRGSPPPYSPPSPVTRLATDYQPCFPERVDHDPQEVLMQQPASVDGTLIIHLADDQPRPKPRDYLWFSILNILFCCWPLGGIALSMSCKARKCAARNDLPGAREYGDSALGINIAALVNGCILNVLLILHYNGFF